MEEKQTGAPADASDPAKGSVGRVKSGPAPAEAKPDAADAKLQAVSDSKPQAASKKKKASSKKPPAPAATSGSVKRRSRGHSMRGLSRRHMANLTKVDRKKQYPLDDGVKLLKELATGTRFTQTVNIVLNLGIDPRHADQMIRGAVTLPKGIGKKKRVIAFCEGEEADKARAAGAIEAGIDELVKKITGGWMEFDVAIAHPRSMSKVGRLGRTLGPQGKMPSPKNGTVTPDVETAVREFAAGKIEFRNDSGGNIHAVVGKADFSDGDLKENIRAFVGHIRKMKPSTSKGTFIRKVCISGTMSPAVELEVARQ